jgi:hypothetical protein
LSALWPLAISYWLLAAGGWLERFFDIQTIQIVKSQGQEARGLKPACRGALPRRSFLTAIALTTAVNEGGARQSKDMTPETRIVRFCDPAQHSHKSPL